MPAMQPGDRLREASTLPDAATGRLTRRLTTGGQYNQTPTYHHRAAFTEDARSIVLVREMDAQRRDASALLCGDVDSGELTVIDVLSGGEGGEGGEAGAGGARAAIPWHGPHRRARSASGV